MNATVGEGYQDVRTLGYSTQDIVPRIVAEMNAADGWLKFVKFASVLILNQNS